MSPVRFHGLRLFFYWIGLFLVIALFFAACSGITIGGVHHEINCSCKHGVVVQ